MDLSILIILHFLIYGTPAFIALYFTKDIQIAVNYVFLGVLFCITQLFNSLYTIQIGELYNINAGDISYSALLFTSIFLILSQPKPIVVRLLVYLSIILSIFLFILFLFVELLLTDSNILNYLHITPEFFKFSYVSMLFSVFLYSSEVLLQLYLMKKIIPLFKNKKNAIIICIALIFFVVLILDGILYPIGINILYPESQFSIINGIIAKSIFGIGFGTLLILFLMIFPNKLSAFISIEHPFRDYILPPKRGVLLKKLQRAEEQIAELEKILPICAKCKKIRDDKGYWNQVEDYLKRKQNISFTHSLCPNCYAKTIDEINDS